MLPAKILRKHITDAIKVMEQGAFQSFTDDFLKETYPELVGLMRHGLTSDGKTRPGTPDSICELSNGKVLAVQSSIAADYWNTPKDENGYDSWKPIEDLQKCSKLDGCERVYLCCSQEIPTNRPLCKSLILKFASQNFPFEVTILSVADIVEKIVQELGKYDKLLSDHMRDIYESLVYGKKGHTALQIQLAYEGSSLSYEYLKKVVPEILEGDPDATLDQVIETAAIRKGQQAVSRFLVSVEKEEGIARELTWENFGGQPINKIISCVGSPKIGKSYLLRQLCLQLDIDKDEVRWYVCPPGSTDEQTQKELELDLRKEILNCVLSEATVYEVLDGRIQIEEVAKEHALEEITEGLIVIDNAEQLSDDFLKRLNNDLICITNLIGVSCVSLILISSRSLNKKVEQVLEYRIPIWNEKEIHELLKFEKIKSKEDIETYSKAVAVFSGGHPLVAIAIANRYNSITEILEAQQEKGQSLYDEKLTEEIEEFLFEQILTDSEERDLLNRASVLISPFTQELIEHLCISADPPISMPASLVLNKHFNTIFEGELPNNILVADLFQKIAMKNVSDTRKKQLHKLAAKFLLTPQKGSLDVVKACEGIMYAILGQDLGVALAFADKMLLDAIFQKWGDKEIEFTLERLWLIRALAPPTDPTQLRLFLSVLLLMTMLYRRIGIIERADEAYRSFLQVLNNKDLVKDIPEKELGYLILQAKMERVWRALISSDYEHASNTIEDLSVELSEWLSPFYYGVLGVILMLTQEASQEHYPRKLMARIIEQITPEFQNLLPVLTQIFVHIGLRFYSNSSELNENLKIFSDISPLGQAMCSVALAERLTKEGDAEKALDLVEQALMKTMEIGIDSKEALWEINRLKADILYKLEYDGASKLYADLVKDVGEHDYSFNTAWCNYRLGLIEGDHRKAIPYFSKALSGFEESNHDYQVAVVTGELATCYFLQKECLKAVQTLEKIIVRYFEKHPFGYGRGVIIAVSILSNIFYNDPPKEEDFKTEGGANHVGLRRGVFASSGILKEASPSYGKLAAHSALAAAYQKFKSYEDMMRCKQVVFSSSVSSDVDAILLVDVAAYGEISLVKVAKFHLIALEMIQKSNLSHEVVLRFGLSLYLQWMLIDYKSISAKSLSVLLVMRDGARSLYELSDVTSDQKSAVMILLLLSLEESNIETETKNGLTSCSEMVTEIVNKLPKGIVKRISVFLET